MTDDKQNKILEELLRRSSEMKYGTMVVEFKVQDGKIVAGEIIEQKIKLG